MERPWFASAVELAREIRAGRLGCAELLETMLERVDRLNPRINAIVVQDRDAARRDARRADEERARGHVRGPLHGVPMTLKESNDRAGWPTTWGDPALRDHRPSEDALAVQRLERAGAVIFGKTNVPIALADFQSYNDVYGTTGNPWDPERVPGGSSGGAAAALAAGLTPLELGSDIGGSIRNPSHFCGTFGHKSTWNLLPPRGHGLGALRPTDIAVIGPMARSAADLELALRVMAGPDEIESAGHALALAGLDKPPSSLRVAVWANDPIAPVAADVEARVRDVARCLAGEGAHVDDSARPGFDPQQSHDTYLSLLWSALAAGMSDADHGRFTERAGKLAPDDRSWRARMTRAQTLSHRDWVIADERRTALRVAWHRFFEQWDVLLLPVMPTTAFAHDHRPFGQRTLAVDGAERPYFDCLFWAGLAGVAYLPSTVIPAGAGADGLPVGVQIVGPAYGDLRTIQLARRLESLGFAFRAPPGYDG